MCKGEEAEGDRASTRLQSNCGHKLILSSNFIQNGHNAHDSLASLGWYVFEGARGERGKRKDEEKKEKVEELTLAPLKKKRLAQAL